MNRPGTTALVFAGGSTPGLAPSEIPAGGLVVAADSGLGHAAAVGLVPDVVVGDLDSVDATQLARAEQAGAVVEQHPADKDETDLELAFDAVMRRRHDHGIDRVVVAGALGGRLDHLLANVSVLASARWAPLDIELLDRTVRAWVVRSSLTVDLPVDATVSLLATGGGAHGVTTSGFRWNLDDAHLEFGSAWGVSNEVLASPVEIAVANGTLLVIAPR